MPQQQMAEARAEAPELAAAPEEGLHRPPALPLVVHGRPQGIQVPVDIDATDVSPVLAEVLPLHPVGAVIGAGEAQCLRDSGVLLPFLAVVGPRPSPLASAPGVPDLHEAEEFVRLPMGTHGAHLQQREGVLLHEPHGLARTCHTAAAQDSTVPVVVAKQIEELILFVALLRGLEGACAFVSMVLQHHHVAANPSTSMGDFEAPRLATGHADDAPLRDASLNRCVAAAELCHGFLKDKRPDFLAIRMGIQCLRHAGAVPHYAIRSPRIALAWHKVVHNDLPPLLRLRVIEADAILPPGVDLLREEAGRNGALVLGERGHGGQQPAVAEGALEDVLCLDLALEQAHVRTEELRVVWALIHVLAAEVPCAHPDNRGVAPSCLGIGCVTTDLTQGGCLRREFLVDVVAHAGAEHKPEQPRAVKPDAAAKVDPERVDEEKHRREDNVVEPACPPDVQVTPAAHEAV
mmetsp:Transcript_63839/g.164317  ORF Transcript_63839/g.164317 Transcript_63839/m.164317 type:complete len:462 (+) Transcript_63839:494-1879(+)